MNVGDKVKHKDPKWYGGWWIGEVREIDANNDIVRIKWDPSFVLPEDHPQYEATKGIWHKPDTLVVVDSNSKIGKQN